MNDLLQQIGAYVNFANGLLGPECPPNSYATVSYLTDTLAWAEYCDTTVADYANGGSSAEMMVLVANLLQETPNENGTYNKMIMPGARRWIYIFRGWRKNI